MGFLANCIFIAVTGEKKTILIRLLICFFLLFIILYHQFGARVGGFLPFMVKCFAHATEVANELTWGL